MSRADSSRASAISNHPIPAGLASTQLNTEGIPLAIALVTFAAFSPALWNDFVYWDDQVNLLNNPDYRGLGWTQLRWMSTTVLMGHWTPLTWMTFGLDYLVWGMHPVGYHLTNLLLHSANAAVFYFVALRLLRLATTGLEESTLRLGAGVSALFFAIHPLRAESVAWATERRDVLSGLFFLLTILTYLKACQAEGNQRLRVLAESVGCYALALAAKSIVMTLPFVLILLDIYPLRRLGGRPHDWATPEVRRVWKEKITYLVLALAGASVASYAVWVNSFFTPLEMYPLSARVAINFYSLWFYLWKTIFPLGLSPLYELPTRVSLLEPPFLMSAIAVALLSGGFWLLRRRWPAGLAVWVAYVIMLAPVSGFPVHSGYQIVHDRYSYLSCLGWALLVGGGVCAVARAVARGVLRLPLARVAAGAAAIWLTGLGVLTWQQVQVWRDTETLWTHALELDPDCSLCHSNLGDSLDTQGMTSLAIEHFQRALALRPDGVSIHGNLGLALTKVGHLSEATEHFHQFLARYPYDVAARNNLAVALMRQGKLGEAVEHLQQANRLNPAHLQVRTNLGVAFTELGRPAEAIEHFRRAIELKPEAPYPHFGLARAYLALGKTDLARAEYEVVKRLDPGIASTLPQSVKP